MSTLQIQTPRVFLPLLEPARYKGAHGGRGSGKSHFDAESLVEKALYHVDTFDVGLRWVCIREVQRSLRESVKRLVEDKIQALGVGKEFDVQRELIGTPGGGNIIFQGMQNHTAESIKSLEGYDGAWVEEAQSLSQRSLDLLRPTIRKAGSEMWFTWNPDSPDDPVEKLLRPRDEQGRLDPSRQPPGAVVVEANFTDNPWFPEELRAEMEFDRGNDLDKYAHTWLGQYRQAGEAQVLRGRCVSLEFEPKPGWNGPYYGGDWGFSVDPTALVKCWVDGRTLYIEAEAYAAGVEVDYLPALFGGNCPDGLTGRDGRPMWENPKGFAGVVGARDHAIRADSARPETISYMQRHGFPRLTAVEKWPGSVEDGVEHLRSYERIVIHPNCLNAIREARLWKWKVDRLTQDVLPQLASGDDNIWDAVRYALAPLIKRRTAKTKPLRM